MATRFAEEKILLTYDDYAKLPNDGLRYEILEGDLLMSPAPKPKHERVQKNLFRVLDPFVLRHHLGELFVAPQDVVLAEHTVVQPDLFFITRPRLHIVGENNIQGPPDLVIEVESDYDERAEWVKKLRSYDRHGVKEVWHVRPGVRVVDVYRRTDTHLEQVERVQANGKLITTLLPKLRVALKRVWV